MDKALAALASASFSPVSFQSLAAYDLALKKHASATQNLSENTRKAILLNPAWTLSAIDPATNSIGFLAILTVLLNTNTPKPTIDRTILLDETLRFLMKFNPYHIRYVGSTFRELLEQVGSLFSPLVAVELLADAILRIEPSGTMFTSTHLIMARIAYDTNCVEPALKVIDGEITSYPMMTSSQEVRRLCDQTLEPASYISLSTGLTNGVIKSTSILEYNLLRALMYLSRRDWPKALAALDQVVAHPTRDKGVSKIMADSHKKWLLVGLLSTGQVPALPPYVGASAKSAFNAMSATYSNIASLFVTTNASKLREAYEKDIHTWEDDGNTALMAEVLAAYQKWQIINLRRIYHQISVSQVRSITLSAETGETLEDDQVILNLLHSMIDSGMLKGDLQVGDSGADSYLTFREEFELMTETDFAREIAQCHNSIESLGKQYKLANERLSGHREYLKHMVREQRRIEKEGADGGMGFDSQIEDEDLMTGVMAHG